LLDGPNALEAGRIMERREFAQFSYHALHLRRYSHRSRVPPATMNNAVPDSVNIFGSK
jgi:hypothetical protein